MFPHDFGPLNGGDGDTAEPAHGHDIFISYNHSDSALALRFCAEVSKRQLMPFIDRAGSQRSLETGGRFNVGIEEAIRKARSVAVLVGPAGMGQTQIDEAHLAMGKQRRVGDRDFPVFKVLLPGCVEPDGDTFLDIRTRIDLRRAIDDEDELAGILAAVPPIAPPVGTGAPRPDRLDTVVSALASKLQKGGVTFFVGPGAARPPSHHDIARHLTSVLRQRTPELPPIPTLDLASACLALETQDEQTVEREIGTLLRAVATRPAGDVPGELAQFLRAFCETYQPVLSVAYPERRGIHRTVTSGGPVILVVVTTYDLSVERALVHAQVPFRRLVQWASRSQIDCTDYDPLVAPWPSDPTGSKADEWLERFAPQSVVFLPGTRSRQRRNPLTSVSLRSDGLSPGFQVALYKPLGSVDCEGSCAISADQHFQVARNVAEGNVPASVTDKVRNNSLVFLGYSVFDPSYRLVHHTLLRDRVGSPNCYIVRPRPVTGEEDLEGRMEGPLWESVRSEWTRRDARLIDRDEAAFFRLLSSGCGLVS